MFEHVKLLPRPGPSPGTIVTPRATPRRVRSITFSGESMALMGDAQAALAEALRLKAGDRAIAEGRDSVTVDDVRAVAAEAMAEVARALAEPEPGA